MRPIRCLAFIAVIVLAPALAAAQTVYERGNSAEPMTFDPQRATSAAEANILADVYEGLVVYDAAGDLIPGAAASWTVSEDALTWTFTLRDGAQWSDGSAVVAGDFVAAFERLFDPETAAPDSALFAAIAGATAMTEGDSSGKNFGVQAQGESVVEITLDAPVPQLLSLLARPSALPVHRDAAALAEPPSASTPTNGAYHFEAYVPGESLTLAKSETFHDATNVAITTVVYRPYGPAEGAAAFEAGVLLSNNDVPIAAMADLGDALHVSPYLGSYLYVANTTGALADVELRRAVAMAIDREALNEDIWSGAMVPAASLVPVGAAGLGGTGSSLDLGPADRGDRLDAARQLLAAAGYAADQLTLAIAIAASDLNRRTAEVIVANLAEIGIAATVTELPPDEHYAALSAEERTFDLAQVAWIADYDHVESFLALFETGGLAGYANPDYDAALAEARATTDRTVREALYAAADRLLMRNLPAIPVLQYASLNLVSDRLLGWIDNAVDMHLSRWMSIAQ